jgi:glycopeptide antibiotics resistance protein
LVPGSAIALVVSIMASGRIGAWLGIHRLLAAFLLFSLGIILVGTLSPLAAEMVLPPEARDTCDFSRTTLATPLDLATRSDVAINILMFMPFGFAVGSIPWTWRKVAVIAAAIALPFAIEGVQLAVLPLGRGCQAADVIDNLTGLLVGVFAGIPISWWPRSSRL